MGDVVLTQTVVIKDQQSPRRIGGLADRKRYIWRGKANAPVFLMQNTREQCFEDIDVVCEQPTEGVFVSERKRTGPGTIPPTMAQLRNVRVYGNQVASRGFWSRATIDENNEHHRFDCVSVYGCTDQAFDFSGQQAKENLLTQCRIESCDIGVVSDSSFQWIGGTCAVATWAIALRRPGDPVLIQGVGFEACRRLLITYGASTDAQPITLIGCRFAADQLAEDGAMIRLTHAGPLTIIGGSYGDGDQRVPGIRCAGIGEQAVNIIGAKFGAFDAAQSGALLPTPPGVRLALKCLTNAYQLESDAAERTRVW